MGDSADTFFWHDPWLGGVPLGVHFRRLAELAVDKYCTATKVQKHDKLTNIPTHKFRFKSFKKNQDGKFKIDVLYGIGMCFNLFMCFIRL